MHELLVSTGTACSFNSPINTHSDRVGGRVIGVGVTRVVKASRSNGTLLANGIGTVAF